jgi:hypothetical protein
VEIARVGLAEAVEVTGAFLRSAVTA